MTDFTKINSNDLYIRVREVCEILEVSEPTAYRVIRQLNEELNSQGFITLAGRTNRSYFMHKVCGHPLTERGA